jgi:GntR family transcriptional regulator, transcriptional repressor for pyruvate dehydrogenase complex
VAVSLGENVNPLRPSSNQLLRSKSPKGADILASELRERILAGEFADGTGLPAERDLVVQTRMSRTTVREALRILEVQGLIRTRLGRTGGAFVKQPDAEVMSNTVDLLIRGRRMLLPALFETREAIEPFCAQLAAIHRTEDELAALERLNQLLSEAGIDSAQFLQAGLDWHIALARASHNEVLSGLMAAFSRAIDAQTDRDAFADVELRRATIRAHSTITNAIRANDADTAARRMRRHSASLVGALVA